jgi:peptidoglycan/LPS O-acetylase OafA/YrhL
VTRLHRLTPLRFVAALLVLGYHLLDDLGPGLGDALGPLLRQGGVGVGFFFVLSGFVLGWSARPGQGRSSFWWRRAARIYPAYVVAWTAAALVGEPASLDSLPGLVLVQAWFPAPAIHYGAFAVGWTLSCEAFFYAAFPFVHRSASGWSDRAVRLGIAVAAASTAAVGVLVTLAPLRPDATRWWSTILPVVRLPEFVAGVLLAVLVRRGVAPRPSLPLVVAAATAAYGAAGQVAESLRPGLLVVPWLLLVLAVAQLDRAEEGAPPAPLLVLGTWSYGVYLVHGLVIDAVRRAVEPGGGAAGDVAFLVLVVVGSVLAAGALWAAVERPVQAVLLRRGPRAQIG